MDNKESCCIFDASRYTGSPDTAPCENTVSVPDIIRELDSLYEQGREDEAGSFLEDRLEKARELGDWRGELSMLSELLGQYRRSGNEAKGLETVNDALALIRQHSMGSTVSGATVMLNAATTLKCFGRAEESIPVFLHVSRVFSSNLDPSDYRFAGLYNNMALSYADIGRTEAAEMYFSRALKIMEKLPGGENDAAVTLCNMAEMYGGLDPEHPRIDGCLEAAWEKLSAPSLKKDGYHAFTISKCAPVFDYFGYFLYAKDLKERAAKIYART